MDNSNPEPLPINNSNWFHRAIARFKKAEASRVAFAERHSKAAGLFNFTSSLITIVGILWTAIIPFVRTNILWLTKGWVVTPLMIAALVLFLINGYSYFQRCRRNNFPFNWTPNIITALLLLVALTLFIPRINGPKFHHPQNEADVIKLVSEHQIAKPHDLIVEGVYLYNHEEFAWSYICFKAAIDSKLTELNQFDAYYIGSLYNTGRSMEAGKELDEMTEKVMNASFDGGNLADSNILRAFADCIFDSKTKLAPMNQGVFSNLEMIVYNSYLRSITNTPPAKRK